METTVPFGRAIRSTTAIRRSTRDDIALLFAKSSYPLMKQARLILQ